MIVLNNYTLHGLFLKIGSLFYRNHTVQRHKLSFSALHACSLEVMTFQDNCGMSSSQYLTLSQWYI